MPPVFTACKLARHLPAAALAGLLASSPASAGLEVVDFEDLAASNEAGVVLTDEYADLGIVFDSPDEAVVWGGLSEGDPGAWQIEGSNGPHFLGFDGPSYGATLGFDSVVEGFQFDIARAAPDLPMIPLLSVQGRLDGEVVTSLLVILGFVDSWTTVQLPDALDEVVIAGTGIDGMRFGIDNLQWVGPDRAPPVQDVRIDIRKHKRLRYWNRSGWRGFAPVVLYGSEEFDVRDVDVESLVLAPGDTRLLHRTCPHFLDLGRDGHLDMLLHFRIRSDRASREAEELCLSGETDSGGLFSGCDEFGWPVDARPYRRHLRWFRMR